MLAGHRISYYAVCSTSSSSSITFCTLHRGDCEETVGAIIVVVLWPCRHNRSSSGSVVVVVGVVVGGEEEEEQQQW